MRIETSYFRDFARFERQGDLPQAFYVLRSALSDRRLADLSSVYRSNLERLVARASFIAQGHDKSVQPLFEHSANPLTYAQDPRPLDMKPIVTLTTISGRLERVAKTIETILKQTLLPHSVNLYISEEPYLIDQGISSADDNLRRIHDLGANIYYVKNTGPYRKQCPLIYQLHASGADPMTPFITIDDDVIYPENIVEMLMAEASRTNAVVSHRGRQITFGNGWYSAYDEFVAPKEKCSLLNIGTGRNGIAYRLKYFPINYADFVGPVIAPTADDLWCKFVTAAYCVPTLILQPEAIFDTRLDFAEVSPGDKEGLFHTFNAKGKNDLALTALEMYFSLSGRSVLKIAKN